MIPITLTQFIRELWKDIPDHEGLYQASNMGRIRSVDKTVFNGKGYWVRKGKILSQSNCKGYKNLSLCKNGKSKTHFVHKLVAMTFLNHKPDGMNIVIDHINEDKIDNRIENLQIITHRENILKSIDKTNTSSKYVGVYLRPDTGRWGCGIKINGRKKHLGYWSDEFMAHKVYLKATREIQNEMV